MLPTARCIAVVFGFATGPAPAQTYPTQTIKIIVATAAGGIADLVARTLAQKLSEGGKTAVVENRTGGAGAIAADAVAKSPPDGHTLLIGMHSINAILPHLVGKLSYDGIKNFAPVTNIVASANILVVNPAVPANSMRELVAYAKANPGKLIYASQGNATSGHIVGEQFKQARRHRPRACALSRCGACHPGSGRRPRVDDVRHRAAGAHAARRRQGARAGGRLAAAACGREPTCRRWRKRAFPSSKAAPGSACWRRPERRARSSTGSMARPARRSRRPTCASASFLRA